MKRPVRILIIEDNEDDTLLEIEEIKNKGLEIIYERIDNPDALKEALNSRTWDCILSDFSLPTFTGLDALSVLKESGQDIPFILISGAIGEEIAVNAMKAGANDYIMKSNLNRLVPVMEREIREAEIRLQKKQAEESMKNERILLRTLIDNLPDLIYFKDALGRKIISNKADIDLTGSKNESDILGKTDLEIYNDEFGKRSHASDLIVIQSGQALINAEEEIIDSAGEKHWYRLTKIPIKNTSGEITGLVGIAHEITDRKKMELALIENEQNLKRQNVEYEALNKDYLKLNEEITLNLERIKKMNEDLIKAKNKAEESDKLKSSFLANMSHEIRTPLNAILGFSAFLKNPELSSDRMNEFIEIIENSGQQLLNIINDILEISQIEAGQIKISTETVNISKLLNELFVQFSKEASSQNIDLVLNINRSAEEIITKTDGTRIRQILSNLLNNAIKFTHEGKVEFAARVQNDQIIFYVKDTGIGIAPEFQKLIFQPFRQVENTISRIYGGNGLGLSISIALVEKLGGKMSLNSTPGKGSTFTFSLPYINEKKEIAENRKNNSVPDYDWKDHVILIAEDEIFNYRFIEEMLSRTSAKVLHARDGNEAVQMVKENPDISLVIMDVKMPGMDGFKATRLIKKIRPTLPVIAQTAAVLNENGELTKEAGFDKLVAKPIEIKQLLEVIDNYLE